jgi:hypothetical protein
MADADADGDGVVTMDELSKAPPPVVGSGELGPGGSSPDAGDGGPTDAGAEAPTTLEALVYNDLLKRVLRVAGGGACEEERRRSW